MDHCAKLASALCCHHIQCILCRISGVDDDRLIQLFGKLKLSGKAFPLARLHPGLFVPVVIQSDFPDGNRLGSRQFFFQPFVVPFRQLLHVGRMNADRRVNKRILLCKGQARGYRSKVRCHINHASDPVFAKGSNQRLPILFKRLIIIMGMCIKYHRFVPVSFLFCASAAHAEVLLHKALPA